MPRDPVCGMNVREGKDSVRSDYNGTTYYFCSDKCRREFDRNPESFTGSQKAGRDDSRRDRTPDSK